MQNNIISGIYCIENKVNNKKYIGQSKNINDRWYKHKNELKHGTHSNDYLQHSWNKYGENNFEFYILEYCNSDKLDEMEIYYIELYDTLNHANGYNLKSGGQDNGVQATEYVKEKISKALKKSYSENEEIKEKRRQDALSQWANPEIKAKILGKNNGMYGKTHSKEARRKISEAQKGRISQHRNTMPVFCIELNKIFIDAVTACNELNINKSRAGNIHEVCKGIRNRKTVGGYHWQYLENNIG